MAHGWQPPVGIARPKCGTWPAAQKSRRSAAISSPAMVTNIAFSPDGRSVFTGGDDDFVRQWDAATGQEIRTFSGDGKGHLRRCPQPGWADAGDGRSGWHDHAVGCGFRQQAAHPGRPCRAGTTPGVSMQDGTRLASAGFDRLAKVWDVATGEELFSLYGNLSNVFGVSFSPDGDTIGSQPEPMARCAPTRWSLTNWSLWPSRALPAN